MPIVLVEPKNNKAKAGSIAAIIAAAALTAAGILSVPDIGDSPGLVVYQRNCALAQSYHTLFVNSYYKGTQGFIIGESFRPQATATYYAKLGLGIENSLHTKKLAEDKFMVIGNRVTWDGADYLVAGTIWKAIGPAFKVNSTWGGDFSTKDYVHFSCSWQGIK